MVKPAVGDAVACVPVFPAAADALKQNDVHGFLPSASCRAPLSHPLQTCVDAIRDAPDRQSDRLEVLGRVDAVVQKGSLDAQGVQHPGQLGMHVRLTLEAVERVSK